MVTLKSQSPVICGFPGFPFCLCDLGPLLGAVETEERSSKSRKCLPSAEGFLCAALGPRGCAPPWNPGRGCPPAPHALQAPPAALPGASRRGAGVPGEERPRHPAGRLGSLRSRQGAVSSPLRGCGPHQPLDPPFTRKTRQRPAQGLGGALSEWMGVKARAATAQQQPLTPRNDPNAPGWWLGVLFPQPPARGERPRRTAGGALAFDFCF